MAPEGTYSIIYQGAAGSGSGKLVLKDNVVTGADPYGGKYSGTYKVDELTKTVKIEAVVTIAPGAFAVNGMSAGTRAIQFPVSASVPVGQVDGFAHTVHTPNGDIKLALRRIGTS